MELANLPQKKLFLAVAVLVVVALAPSLYFYFKYRQAQTILTNPTLASREEAKAYADKLSRYLLLPENEEPTIMTITDVERLKNQLFFQNAKNGDKVLIYNLAKKAILFDPTSLKIIEIGPLINQTPTPPPPTLPPSQPTPEGPTLSPTKSVVYKVFLYNGTTTTGLTKTVENILKDRPAYTIVDRDNAQKKDYSQTLIIDLTGRNKSEAEALASLIKGQISTLPAGETKPPDSDFLIIVGADKK